MLSPNEAPVTGGQASATVRAVESENADTRGQKGVVHTDPTQENHGLVSLTEMFWDACLDP